MKLADLESKGVTSAELNISNLLKGPFNAEFNPNLCDPEVPAYAMVNQIGEFQKFVTGNLQKQNKTKIEL